MDWTIVGALGEAGGAIAVVASLLYVGSRVRQNNRIARAEAYRDVTMGWARLRAFVEGRFDLGRPEGAEPAK